MNIEVVQVGRAWYFFHVSSVNGREWVERPYCVWAYLNTQNRKKSKGGGQLTRIYIAIVVWGGGEYHTHPVIGWTMCKTLAFCSKNSDPIPVMSYLREKRYHAGSPRTYIFGFRTYAHIQVLDQGSLGMRQLLYCTVEWHGNLGMRLRTLDWHKYGSSCLLHKFTDLVCKHPCLQSLQIVQSIASGERVCTK